VDAYTGTSLTYIGTVRGLSDGYGTGIQDCYIANTGGTTYGGSDTTGSWVLSGSGSCYYQE
jgi:hypothetical protein